MNKQNKIPKMQYVSRNDLARTIRGMVTQFLSDECGLEMSPKDRSGKFQRLSKNDLLSICNVLRYNTMTVTQVKEYLASAFGINLEEIETNNTGKSPLSQSKTIMVEIEYSYDSVNFNSIKQHEIMLMSIHHFWMDEIKKSRLFVSSTENKSAELNTITIRLTSAMKESAVRKYLEAMNIAAYFAVHPDRLGEQFELAAKSM